MPDRFHLLVYLCIYTEPVKFTAMQVNVKQSAILPESYRILPIVKGKTNKFGKED